MGGKKKQSMKQQARSQTKKKPAKKEKSAAATPSGKKGIPGITPPNSADEKLTQGIMKMKVITPFSIASRFDLRLSVARRFIQELEQKGKIQFVSRSRNLRIYRPAN
ncbi:MAG: 40S ribosomal protein S25 [Candidatus Bathyarchaeota archaeon]|nr:40S ribosomal protein S25 [Candidatus Bathyarchaeota archaeon]